METEKNILKKSKVYKFLSYNFLNLKNCMDLIRETQIKMDKTSVEFQHNVNSEIDNLNNRINCINDKIEVVNSKVELVKLIEERTKQFDYINTELLMLNNNNKEKILLVGFYGAPNSGDELMLQSLLEKIDSTKYSVTVMLADNPEYKLENYKNINFIHYPKTNMDINIIANYFDKVIFGGGALIEDEHYNKNDSYKYNTATILIDLSIAAILNNKKVYCLGLSTSKELNNKEYIAKLDFIIENSKYFSLRDLNSLYTLKEYGIKNINKINVIYDLAFSLKNTEYKFEELNNSGEFIIGLVLIGFSDKEKLKNIITWTCECSKTLKKSIEIRLIPFYDFCKSDIVNLTKIANEINVGIPIKILPYFQEYEDIMDAFSKCNLIINMRYHSSLLSLKTGIPSLHIVYDIHTHYKNKMKDLEEKYNIPELFLSYENLNKENMYNSLDYAFNNISKINLLESNVSKQICDRAIEQHTSIIKNILED